MCGIFCAVYYNNAGLEECFNKIRHRGPDKSTYIDNGSVVIGFHRLAIMGLTSGDQPFEYKGAYLICNGEIYNSKALAEEIGYVPVTGSDCEVLLPLYFKYGLDFVYKLDGEFAIVIYHGLYVITISDHLRNRPIFYHSGPDVPYAVSSEAKALVALGKVEPFPRATIRRYSIMECSYTDMLYHSLSKRYVEDNLIMAQFNIRNKFIAEVEKRLISDAPIAFLLSGGLDSSLCAAVAAKIRSKITTFTVSFDPEGPDLLAARQVAKHIGSDHHEYIISVEEGISKIPEVIYAIESWCTTTVRASVPQYILCSRIKRDFPHIKVIISGEISDELFGGYEYFKNSPNALETLVETKRLLKNIHLYDSLRADRCVSAHGMELRTPFHGKELINYVLRLDPNMKYCGKGVAIEKQLLRNALGDFLPTDIAKRSKMGMSDAVGIGKVNWVDSIKAHALSMGKTEDIWYRELYDRHYKDQPLIPKRWMPNPSWYDYVLTDPSARILPTFGK